MATYAIGDVQGCYSVFLRLLERIGFDETQDRLWLVGDLVNRGPRNLEMLRFARARPEQVIAVLGNHDIHLIARHLGVDGPRRRDTLDDILTAPDREDLLGWLRERPLLHREGPWVLVHAGLLPAWSLAQAEALAREVEEVLRSDHAPTLLREARRRIARAWRDELQGIERWTTALQAFTVLRAVNLDGTPDLQFAGPVDDLPNGKRPWFELPSRREPGNTVLFGHWAALGLHLSEAAIGLDTGAVWGNALTAIRLEDRRVFREPA